MSPGVGWGAGGAAAAALTLGRFRTELAEAAGACTRVRLPPSPPTFTLFVSLSFVRHTREVNNNIQLYDLFTAYIRPSFLPFFFRISFIPGAAAVAASVGVSKFEATS